MTIKAFIKQHPVMTYYILVFAISWSCWVLVVGPNGLLGTQKQMETVLPLAVLGLLVGPVAAGILLTSLISGRKGLRELLSRLHKWRVGIRWYAVALLPAMFLTAVVIFILSLTCPFTTENKVIVLMSGIGAGFLTILEELGWTGFAVPRLRLRYSILTTGLIVGILWGVWHFPQVLWVSNVYNGSTSLAIFLSLYLLSGIFVLTAYRILLVWVYDRTESILVTILMHASLTAGWTVIFRPLETGISFLTYQWVFAAILWFVVVVVAVANGWQLSLKVLPKRRTSKLQFGISEEKL